MKVKGNKPGKEHIIAGFKQGGHIVVPTFRAAKGESFEVKTPGKGTTAHKNQSYLMDSQGEKVIKVFMNDPLTKMALE